jgi:regulator of protease activity HflC (stomatin/prohibitin superfamily)
LLQDALNIGVNISAIRIQTIDLPSEIKDATKHIVAPRRQNVIEFEKLEQEHKRLVQNLRNGDP